MCSRHDLLEHDVAIVRIAVLHGRWALQKNLFHVSEIFVWLAREAATGVKLAHFRE